MLRSMSSVGSTGTMSQVQVQEWLHHGQMMLSSYEDAKAVFGHGLVEVSGHVWQDIDRVNTHASAGCDCLHIWSLTVLTIYNIESQ